jgi:hypothetical protein
MEPNIYRQITDGDYNQLMLERKERLEIAIQKAENFIASAEDWAIIRYECGVSAQNLEKVN